MSKDIPLLVFLTFRCRNCLESRKIYSIRIFVLEELPEVSSDCEILGKAYKFGENPSFGPPTPTRVNILIGPERDYFFKGQRAESQGLGIAAFAYYRRVVESQKNRILDEIIRVVRKTSYSKDLLD